MQDALVNFSGGYVIKEGLSPNFLRKYKISMQCSG